MVNTGILEKKLWRFEVSDLTALIMVGAYSIVFSYYTIMRHYSFRSNAWDLGIPVQSIPAWVTWVQQHTPDGI